jgi:hypothetical protein
MKRIHSCLALTALLLFAGSSFALQGRVQGKAGAPSNPALAGNANRGDENLGKGNVDGVRAGNAESIWKIEGFKNHGQYVAAQHVSENLGIPFEQLKAKMTGPHAESLGKAIQELTGLPASTANVEAKKAEQASKSESKKN